VLLGQLTWLDRHGQVIGTTGPPAYYSDIALSPDERRIAASVEKDGFWEFRVMESGQRGFQRLASTSRNIDLMPFLLWAHDSEHVLYVNRKPGDPDNGYLMEQAISRLGEPARVRQAPSNYLYALTPDGKSLLTSDGARHLALLPLAEGGKPVAPLPTTTTTFQAVLSPDGHWIAYESTGEILAERYPVGDDRRRISEKGGSSPYWRADGKELIYAGSKNVLFSVSVDPVRGVFGAPAPLFSVARTVAVGRSRSYAVTRDGSRILVSKYVEQPGPHLVSIAADWEAELRKSSH
jgi:Tol biopolymer transport system component